MSAMLQRRRGAAEGGNDRRLEEGNVGAKEHGDDANVSSMAKIWRECRRRWQLATKLAICNYVLLVAVVLFCFFGLKGIVWNKPRIALPIPNVDVDVPGSDEWPLVHIVQTRFMQEQGPMEILGMARLKLFLTFCLPSMVLQTTQNFFWIIKTDPKFTSTSVFKMLVRSVQSYDNIYVVASNANFLFGSGGREGSWRDGKEALDLLQSKIYTGNTTKLHVAMALRNERPVLETRLDADDGLHENYIKYIQKDALKRFQPPEDKYKGPIPQWLYWCTRRHIEWHSAADPSLPIEQINSTGSPEIGYLNTVQHDKLCVTPGVTIGYNIDTKDKSKNILEVPQYDHDKLYKSVRDFKKCYERKYREGKEFNGPCLELVEKDFYFCAIRARTWTSAGMYGVDLLAKDVPSNYEETQKLKMTETLWNMLTGNFGVNDTMVLETQSFLVENKKAIAHENLLGQCASGHSCKDSAKEELKRIMDGENKKSRLRKE